MKLINIFDWLKPESYMDKYIKILRTEHPEFYKIHCVLDKLGFIIYNWNTVCGYLKSFKNLSYGMWIIYHKNGCDYYGNYFPNLKEFIWSKIGLNLNLLTKTKISFEKVFESFSNQDKQILLYDIDLFKG